MGQTFDAFKLLHDDEEDKNVEEFVNGKKQNVSDNVDALDLLHSENSQNKQSKLSSKDVQYDYDKSVGTSGMLKGSFASDEKEWLRNAAKTLYPNEPVDTSLQRFGKTREGDWYHTSDDGNVYKVRPEGFLPNVASGTGYAIPAVTGTLGAIGGAVYGAGFGAVPVASSFGGIGEYMRQKSGDLLMGPEVSTKDVNWKDVAKETILSGFGEGLNQVGSKFYNRLTAKDFSRFDPQRTNEAYDRSARYNVPITPAEATRMKSLQAQQERIANRASTTNQMDEFEIDRNARARQAWDTYLDTNFGPRTDASSVSKNASDIAEKISNTAKQERSDLTRPFYDPLKSVTDIDTKPVQDFINEKLKTAKFGTAKVLSSIQQALQKNNAEDKALDTSFEGVQNIKLFVRDLLTDPQTQAKFGLSGGESLEQGGFKQILDLLENSIKSAPSNKGMYETANTKFAEISKDKVEPIREALAPLFGVNVELGRKLTTAADSVLNENTRSPEVIKRARKLFVDAGQSDAWNKIVRTFLQDRTVDATKKGPKGRLFSDKISKQFGGEYLDENIKAAMHPSQFAAYKDIMQLFDDISTTTYKNSLTAYKNLEIEQSEKQKGMFGALASGLQVNQWPTMVADKLGEAFRDRQAQIAVDLITSNDRNAINKLRMLKTLKGNDLGKSSAALQILSQAGYLGPMMTGYGDPYSK